MKAHLVECGRKFISLMGVHHCWYKGDAFYMRKGQPIKVHVSSRIMIDAVFFQEANANYTRPRINECVQQGSSNGGWIIFGTDGRSTH